MAGLQQENDQVTGAKKEGSALRAFFASSFGQSVAMLLLTALVSGLVVPYIMDLKAKRDIKLQAQAALLENISETLMTYETQALDLSFFKAYPAQKDSADAEQNELYQRSADTAISRYLNSVTDIFIQLRIQVIKANSLASPGISKKLYYFHKDVLKDQDFRISDLLAKNASVQQWKEMHAYNRKILARATILISDIATDFRLNAHNEPPLVDSTYAP